MKLGILIHFDPTVKKINSEIMLLNGLVSALREGGIDPEVEFIACMSRAANLASRFDFDFSYSCTSELYKEYDAIIAWNSTNMSNFFGGMASETFVRYYELISFYTNNNVPILYRSGDSENEIYDYHDVVMERADNDEKFAARNKELIDRLLAAKPIDYTKFFMLVNGERDIWHWPLETYTVRKPAKFLTKEICDQSLYVGDDICFQVLEKYHMMKDKLSDVRNDSLFWIGFVESRNAGRKKTFNELLPGVKVPVTLHTNSDLSIKDVHCITEGIEGDTVEYFKYLSTWLGYIFIGKGTENCAYVNKTVYDAFIARIPLLVYAKTDQRRMIFPDHPQFYFNDLSELEALYHKLNDPAFNAQVVAEQAEVLHKRLTAPQDLPRFRSMFAHCSQTEKTKGLLEF